MLYNVLKMSVYYFLKIYNRLTVISGDKIPDKGPLIIVANHSSYLDPIYLSAVMPWKLNYMAKKESFNNLVGRTILSRLGAFPVDRSKADIKAIKTAIRLLKSENVLAIFPQGERRDESEITDIKNGASYFALKTKTPILPVYIKGTDKVMPKGQFLIKPNKVKIFIGNPINISDIVSTNQDEILITITNNVKSEINSLIEQSNKKSTDLKGVG